MLLHVEFLVLNDSHSAPMYKHVKHVPIILKEITMAHLLLDFIHFFFTLKAQECAFPATPTRCFHQPPVLKGG